MMLRTLLALERATTSWDKEAQFPAGGVPSRRQAVIRSLRKCFGGGDRVVVLMVIAFIVGVFVLDSIISSRSSDKKGAVSEATEILDDECTPQLGFHSAETSCEYYGLGSMGEGEERRRVVDVSVYRGNHDLLELRIRELAEVVDLFLVVEIKCNGEVSIGDDTRIKEISPPHKISVVTGCVQDNEGDEALTRLIVGGLKKIPNEWHSRAVLFYSTEEDIPRPSSVRVLSECSNVALPVALIPRAFIFSFQFQLKAEEMIWATDMMRAMSGNLVGYGEEERRCLADSGWQCRVCGADRASIEERARSLAGKNWATHYPEGGNSFILDLCKGEDLMGLFKGGLKVVRSVVGLPETVVRSLKSFKRLLPDVCPQGAPLRVRLPHDDSMDER